MGGEGWSGGITRIVWRCTAEAPKWYPNMCKNGTPLLRNFEANRVPPNLFVINPYSEYYSGIFV